MLHPANFLKKYTISPAPKIITIFTRTVQTDPVTTVLDLRKIPAKPDVLGNVPVFQGVSLESVLI